MEENAKFDSQAEQRETQFYVSVIEAINIVVLKLVYKLIGFETKMKVLPPNLFQSYSMKTDIVSTRCKWYSIQNRHSAFFTLQTSNQTNNIKDTLHCMFLSPKMPTIGGFLKDVGLGGGGA